LKYKPNDGIHAKSASTNLIQWGQQYASYDTTVF